MAKRAKESEPSAAEREAGVTLDEPGPSSDIPPEVKAKPALPPPPPRLPPNPPPVIASGPSFGERVGRFFRFLLRLVFLLIALAIIGVALYILLPEFYQRFVRPVEQNSIQVRELQSRQPQIEQELADLRTQLETIETVQDKNAESLTELDQRMSEIETEITARTQSLATLERMQSEIQEQNEFNSADLKRQIELLKAMELLSRARLFMYQSNFGLARQDVQIARDLLARVQPDAPDSLGDDLDAVVLRLDMTLSNLPDFPVAASDDLDIAWQILLSGLPEVTPTVNATPTQAGSAAPTSTAADVTITPTVSATVQPSVTP